MSKDIRPCMEAEWDGQTKSRGPRLVSSVQMIAVEYVKLRSNILAAYPFENATPVTTEEIHRFTICLRTVFKTVSYLKPCVAKPSKYAGKTRLQFETSKLVLERISSVALVWLQRAREAATYVKKCATQATDRMNSGAEQSSGVHSLHSLLHDADKKLRTSVAESRRIVVVRL